MASIGLARAAGAQLYRQDVREREELRRFELGKNLFDLQMANAELMETEKNLELARTTKASSALNEELTGIMNGDVNSVVKAYNKINTNADNYWEVIPDEASGTSKLALISLEDGKVIRTKDIVVGPQGVAEISKYTSSQKDIAKEYKEGIAADADMQLKIAELEQRGAIAQLNANTSLAVAGINAGASKYATDMGAQGGIKGPDYKVLAEQSNILAMELNGWTQTKDGWVKPGAPDAEGKTMPITEVDMSSEERNKINNTKRQLLTESVNYTNQTGDAAGAIPYATNAYATEQRNIGIVNTLGSSISEATQISTTKLEQQAARDLKQVNSLANQITPRLTTGKYSGTSGANIPPDYQIGVPLESSTSTFLSPGGINANLGGVRSNRGLGLNLPGVNNNLSNIPR